MPAKSRPFPIAYTVAFIAFLLAVAAGVATVWSKSAETTRHRSMTPPVFGELDVIYAQEETWGFGPGGNETGIVVFELPDDVAKKIAQQGLAYLGEAVSARTDAGVGRQTRSPYGWQATPVLVEGTGDDTNKIFSSDIGAYLDRYGFGLAIDKKLEEDINAALSTPGSFVDDNGRRLIILMPTAAKLVFAYRG